MEEQAAASASQLAQADAFMREAAQEKDRSVASLEAVAAREAELSAGENRLKQRWQELTVWDSHISKELNEAERCVPRPPAYPRLTPGHSVHFLCPAR